MSLLSKSFVAYLKQSSDNPQYFRQGKGKNVNGKTYKGHTQKQKNVHKKEYTKYNHSKRTDKFEVQGILDLMSSKVGIPKTVQDDVSEILRPISELNDKFTRSDVEDILSSVNKIANSGIKHTHNIGFSQDTILALMCVMVLACVIAPNKWVRRFGMVSSVLIIILKTSQNVDLAAIVSFVSDIIFKRKEHNDFIGIDEDDSSDEEEEYHDFTTQGIDPGLMMRSLALIFCGYSMYNSVGSVSVTSLSKIDKIFKTLPVITLSMKCADDILSTILSLVEVVGTFIGQLFSPTFALNLKGETWYEYEIIRRRLDELIIAYDAREDMGNLARKAKIIQADLKALGTPRDQGSYVKYRDLNNMVAQLVDDLARFGAVGNNSRKEPLVIVVGGDPGIGKSYVKDAICDIMAKHMLKRSSFREYTECSGAYEFSPNQTEKFVSGYINQKFVIMDDLGYSNDSVDTMLPRFIQMVNSMPYNVEQAELHKKGAVYFDSELILCTTNIQSWGQCVQQLKAPEALCRRLHLTFWCELKSGFNKNNTKQLDANKISDFSTVEWLSWFKTDAMTGQKTPLCSCGYSCKNNRDCEPATFADILLMCVDENDTRTNTYKSIENQRKIKYQTMLKHEQLTTREMIHMLHGSVTQGTCGYDYCFDCNRYTDDQMIKVFNKYFNQINWDLRTTGGQVTCNCSTWHPEKCSKEHFEAHSALLDEEWKRYGMNALHVQEIEKIGGCIRSRYSSSFKDKECEIFLCMDMMKYMDYKRHLNKQPSTLYYNKMLDCYEWFMDQVTTLKDKAINIYNTIRKYVKRTFLHPLYELWEDPIWKAMLISMGFCIVAPLLGGITTRIAHGVAYAGWKTKKQQKAERKQALLMETQNYDINGEMLMKSVVHSNVLHAYINDSFAFTCFGIGGSIVVVNEHTIDKLFSIWKPETVVLKRWGSRSNRWTGQWKLSQLNPNQIYRYENCDLVAISFPGLECRSMENCTNNDIITGDITQTYALARYDPYAENAEYFFTSGPSMKSLTISAWDEALKKKFTTQNTLMYRVATRKGDCGLPVFEMNSLKKEKLLGIHCAGNGEQGNAVRLTRKMIKDAFAFFPQGKFVVQDNVVTMSKENVFYGEMPKHIIPDCQVIGRVNTKTTTLKSEICKSLLYKKIPGFAPNLMPAILVPKVIDGVLTCPIEKNVSAYARGFIMPEMDIMNGVTMAYMDILKKNQKSEPKLMRFLTFEESVQGEPTMKYFKSINRGTSAGYPDKIYMGNKKRDAFGYDTEFTFETEEAKLQRKAFNEAMLALEQGPIEMIASIFPKDELRAEAKAKALKTRLIAGFSCHTTLVIRSIFGPFVDWFSSEDNRIENFSAVGANVAGFDWTRIGHKHGMGDPNRPVKAGDHSSFDKVLNPFVMERVFDIWMEMIGSRLSDKEQTIARNCWKSILAVKVVCKDNLIAWGNSNSSGNPLTTLINTICNILLLMYSITRGIKSDISGSTNVLKLWREIGDSVTLTCYGDDNVWSYNKLCPYLIKYGADLSYSNISIIMKSIGYTYTDEMKSDSFDETHRTIYDVGFLKRSFVKERGNPNLLAPLDFEVIMQKIQWAKKKDVDHSLFFIKFETFLAELSVHKKEVYDKYSKILIDALREQVAVLPIVTTLSQEDRRIMWAKTCDDL